MSNFFRPTASPLGSQPTPTRTILKISANTLEEIIFRLSATSVARYGFGGSKPKTGGVLASDAAYRWRQDPAIWQQPLIAVRNAPPVIGLLGFNPPQATIGAGIVSHDDGVIAETTVLAGNLIALKLKIGYFLNSPYNVPRTFPASQAVQLPLLPSGNLWNYGVDDPNLATLWTRASRAQSPFAASTPRPSWFAIEDIASQLGVAPANSPWILLSPTDTARILTARGVLDNLRPNDDCACCPTIPVSIREGEVGPEPGNSAVIRYGYIHAGCGSYINSGAFSSLWGVTNSTGAFIGNLGLPPGPFGLPPGDGDGDGDI